MDNSKPLQIEDEKIDTEGMRRILGSAQRPADRSTVWRAVKRGYIPPPRHLTPARPYWLRREILALIEQPAEVRKEPQTA
jgi:hypothetical protein